MAALLQVQESEPGQGLYWLDVSRNNNSIPRSDFSPVYFDVGYSRFSSTLHESVPGAKLRPPFISWPSIRLHGLGLEVELLVCARGSREQAGDPFDNVTSITYQSWANASHGYFSCRTCFTPLQQRNIAKNFHQPSSLALTSALKLSTSQFLILMMKISWFGSMEQRSVSLKDVAIEETLCLKSPSRSQDSPVSMCLKNHRIYITRSMRRHWRRSSMTFHCTNGSPLTSRFQFLIQV